MKNYNWRKNIGLVLSVLVLLVGSVSLTGCEAGEEGEGLEQEEELEDDD